MKFTDLILKLVRVFWITVGIGVVGIIGAIGYLFYQIHEDQNFGYYEIPEKFSHLRKPIESFSNRVVLDSLEFLEPEDAKLLITGTGYSGYTFYYWHKPNEKGKIYIRGFESEREIELMKERLPKKTEKIIKNKKGSYQMYSSSETIHEGTFLKYYPARFELWYESSNGKLKKKLTEVEYLIDGWDR